MTGALVMVLLCMPCVHTLAVGASARATVTLSAATTTTEISIEDAASLFGRLSDAKHVFSEPIRTAASGFEFSENTAIRPKWLIAYVAREPSGEDCDLPTHYTRWSQLLFPDGAEACSRKRFDGVLCDAEYAEPLGLPKWSIPGQVLIDSKACAAPPSAAVLDALWTALGGGGGDELACDRACDRLSSWATSDPLNEAVLFSEFVSGLRESSA